jgi:hypothetical protein
MNSASELGPDSETGYVGGPHCKGYSVAIDNPWFLAMDQISIKTPNPKCRLYWCLIEFIDWRYSQLYIGIFTPLVN